MNAKLIPLGQGNLIQHSIRDACTAHSGPRPLGELKPDQAITRPLQLGGGGGGVWLLLALLGRFGALVFCLAQPCVTASGSLFDGMAGTEY